MINIYLSFYFVVFFSLFPQLYAQDSSDTSQIESALNDRININHPSEKSDTILQPNNLASSDSTLKKSNEITIENEDDILIIDDSDEDILITDDSEENSLIESNKNTSPTISTEPEKNTDKELHDQTTSDINTHEENVESNPQAGDSLQKQEEKKKAIIEEARSINFSKNLKEYRSPKKAMFMSLLIPGLGQAYSKKYWKTAVFGGIEIGLIGLSAKFIYEGNQEQNRARKYADQNYNVQKFIEFYNNYSTYTTTLSAIDSTDTMDLTLVFNDSPANISNKYSTSNLSNYESNERKDFDKDIQSIEFVQGWNDCEPYFDKDAGFLIDAPQNAHYKFTYKHYYTNTSQDETKNDTTWLLKRFNRGDTINAIDKNGIYGYSDNQNVYNDMIRSSTGLYNASKYMIFIILTNHVVSAIDAFISARAYNDNLLKKQSIWQNINLDHTIVFTNHGIQSQFGFRIRF